MEKIEAVASMGQQRLLLPVWIQAAIHANERLKLFLSVLQSAAAHAEQPGREVIDLTPEMATVPTDAPWLRKLPSTASLVDGALLVPDLTRLVTRLAEELVTMSRPLLEVHGATCHERVQHWLDWLRTLEGDQLTSDQLGLLTRGVRASGGDSLHILVMDLHKQLNELANTLATEEIDGAHVWQVRPDDRARIAAFMRGLNRTAPLKFDHPGLGTAATRDGDRLLIQNDIGMNDVHVLVVQVEGTAITLNYSDLHRARFRFFESLMAPYGARWGDLQSKIEGPLNAGEAFTFGTARFACADETALDATLEGIGSRIVFLIDWNRARKRLLPFVGKDEAIEVLREAANLDAGHAAWLQCGGEALIYGAMQAVGNGAFRIGDRLDAVLGAADARGFCIELLRLASQALRNGQPPAYVADKARMLLAHRVRKRSTEFELLEEHAAYCHALAQAVSDALEHDITNAPGDDIVQRFAVRAKRWERQADHLVMRARDEAQRQPHWQPFARLLELSDDVADALEEAAFLMSLVADGHQQGWNSEVRDALSRLARTVLIATQEHIKALAIAHDLRASSEAADSDAFVAATWNVLHAERQCDELLRHARRTVLSAMRDAAAALMLANDLALSLELASDRLLAVAYALRDVVFSRAGEFA